MTGGYVCASCRRTLLLAQPSFPPRWQRAVSYVSFIDRPEPTGAPNQNPGLAVAVDADNEGYEARPPRPIPIQQPLQSVEDDFVQRLLAGRGSDVPHGPYSARREPRKRVPTQPQASPSLQNSSPHNPQLNLKKARGKQKREERLDPVPNNALLREKNISSIGYASQGLPSQLLFVRRRKPKTIYFQVRKPSGPGTDASRQDPSTSIVAQKHLSTSASLPEDQSGVKTSVEFPGEVYFDLPVSVHDAVLAGQATEPGSRDSVHSYAQEIELNTENAVSLPVVSDPASYTADESNQDLRPTASMQSHPDLITGSAPEENVPDVSESSTPIFQVINDPKPHGDVIANQAGPRVPISRIATTTTAETFAKSIRPVAHLNTADLETAISNPQLSLTECWVKFCQLQKLAQNRHHVIRKSTRVSLFSRLLDDWSTNKDSNIIITPSAALRRIFGQNRQPDLMSWVKAVWVVIVKFLRAHRTNIVEGSFSMKVAMLLELSSLWDMVLHRAAPPINNRNFSSSKGQVAVEWDKLVQSEQMEQIRLWFSKSFSARLQAFFPTITTDIVNDFDTAALLSFAILQGQVNVEPSLDHPTLDSRGFRRFIAHLLPSSDLETQLGKHIAALRGHIVDDEDLIYISMLIRDVVAKQSFLHAEIGDGSSARRAKASTKSSTALPGQQMEDFFKKRIARTIEDHNVIRLENIWREASAAYPSPHRKELEGAIPVSVFGAFLTAYMALQKPNRAVDVWNIMMKSSILPTIATWDAMLKGSGIARDVKALHDIWRKMIASGTQPDAQVWATRIRGAAMAGDAKYAIGAFQEMCRAWVEEVQKSHKEHTGNFDLASLEDVNGVPKPNIQTVNGLVQGLARTQNHEQIANILAWAQQLGIKADAYTFNPLLRDALVSGRASVVSKLLEQMQKLGIKPDVATYTMMLHSLFRHAASSKVLNTDMSWQEAAQRILDEMHSQGLKSNAWTFGTLIDGMLKGPEGANIAGALTVVDFMATNNIPLSSQIYTALLTHHFNQQPVPDLAGVEALWNRARMDSTVFLDVYFYDRLIEGFALCDETGKMMIALAQAGKRGKTPGWPAMTEVVAALMRAGDRIRAEDIVATIVEEERSLDKIRKGKGSADFWRLVDELGLAPREVQLPTVEQEPKSATAVGLDENLQAPV